MGPRIRSATLVNLPRRWRPRRRAGFLWCPREGAAQRRSAAALNLLDLVEAHLDRRLPAEDRDEHLEPRRVLVDLGDLAGEVGERTRHDLDRLADAELRAGAGALG